MLKSIYRRFFPRLHSTFPSTILQSFFRTETSPNSPTIAVNNPDIQFTMLVTAIWMSPSMEKKLSKKNTNPIATKKMMYLTNVGSGRSASDMFPPIERRI